MSSKFENPAARSQIPGAEEILSEYKLQERELISAAEVEQIIEKYKAEIAEGVSRMFYHSIKSSLIHRRLQSVREPIYHLKRRSPKEETGHNILDFIWYLKTQAKTSEDRWQQNQEPKLIFTYSMSHSRANQEEQQGTTALFTGTDAFKLEKIDLVDFDGSKSASFENFKELLRVLQPPETFAQADLEIDRIWRQYGLLPEDAAKLKQAISEFGNFDFKLRGGLEMSGACLTTLNDFERLVEFRHGIKLNNCELTGARKRRENYSSGERAELDREKSASSVHYASIYQNKVIIDWTSRQYDKDKPIPEIIYLDDRPELKSQIKISEK